MRLLYECRYKRRHVLQAAGLGKDPGMRRDSNHSRQNLGGHPVRHFARDHVVKPAVAQAMVNAVGAKRVQQHVNVGKNQRRLSITSKRAEVSFKSTPGSTPPRARETGRTTRFREDLVRDCARTNRKPCSISAVRVTRRRPASCLAWRSNESSRRTVVLICLDILYLHLYVSRKHGPAEIFALRRARETGRAIRFRRDLVLGLSTFRFRSSAADPGRRAPPGFRCRPGRSL